MERFDRMTGNVLKEIEENIKDYEEQGIEQIPFSLVKYWISVIEKENEELKEENKNLRKCINTIYIISSKESVE